MSAHTPSWVAGYGDGVTGPKTPSFVPTVLDAIRHREWESGQSTYYPDPFYTVVSCGKDTVAIVPGEKDERERNARLIAAAPELLAALKAMHEAFWGTSHNSDEDQANALAKAAIAKAEGR
jgi:hypothetical protein